MKKNDWILIISIALYSYLFYQQSPGINFFLFNIFLVIASVLRDNKVLKNTQWIFAAVGSILSSFAIMYYSSPLSIIANVISFCVLASFSLSAGVSVFTGIFMSIVSVSTSGVFMFIDWAERKRQNIADKISRPAYVNLLIVTTCLIVSTIFFFMYKEGNPLFNDFAKDINLDFISFPWIFFTISGLIIMYGFFYNKRFVGIANVDEKNSNTLYADSINEKNFINKLITSDSEKLSGVMLLSILNILLFTVNSLDVTYLWFDGKLPADLKHKDFVHNGVGTLIMSVICAILIILFYFRGRQNFSPANKVIKLLAHVWIIQNVFMIVSTVYRNNMYIGEYGLSYKKIGVYAYLILTMIGLITAYVKIAKIKSNWFLFRSNALIAYALLIIGSLINWDVAITSFNVNKAISEGKKVEKYFLLDLSFKNIPQLINMPSDIKTFDDMQARNYYNRSRGVSYAGFEPGLHKKIFDFMKGMEDQKWQSWSYEKQRVFGELLEEKNIAQINFFKLNHYNQIQSLSPVKYFKKLESLDLSTSNFDSLSELAWFPELKDLKLSDNQMASIDLLPLLNNLQSLDISSNSIQNFKTLSKFPKLKHLDVAANGIRNLDSLPQFPVLESLSLSDNKIDNYNKLSSYSRLNSLVISKCFTTSMDSFPIIPKLETLDISNNSIGNSYGSVKLFQLVIANKSVKDLSLSDNLLSDLSFLSLGMERGKKKNTTALVFSAPEASFPLLEKLDVENNNLSYITGISNCRTLKQFYAANNKITDIKLLSALSLLEELSIYNNPINDISSLKTLTNLLYVDVSGCGIRVGLDSLAQLKKLKYLYVSKNELANIEFVLKMDSLEYLDLSYNAIQSLKGINQLKQLKYLDLRNNNITEWDELYKLVNLKELKVTNISERELVLLEKALPNCVVRTGTADN